MGTPVRQLAPSVTVFLFLTAMYLLGGYYEFPANHALFSSDYIIPSLALRGDLTLVEGSIERLSVPHDIATTLGPRSQVFLADLFGVDLIDIEKARTLFGIAAALVGCFLAGWAVSRSPTVGLMVAAVLPISWITSLTIGYEMHVFSAIPAVGNWGMTLSVLVWSLWLGLGGHRFSFVVPYALAGLVFNYHPTYGIILSATFGLFELGELFRAHAWRSASKRLCVGGLAFLLCAMPSAVSLIASFPQARSTNSAHSWWVMMLADRQHHVFPWRLFAGMSGFVLCAVLYGALLAMTKSKVAEDIWRRLLVTLAAVIAFVMISLIGVEVLKADLLGSLTLTRSSFLLPLGAAIMTCFLFSDALKRVNEPGSGTGSVFFALGEALWLPLILVAPVRWPIPGLAALALVVCGAWKSVERSAASRTSPLCLVPIGVILVMVALQFVFETLSIRLVLWSVFSMVYAAALFGFMIAPRTTYAGTVDRWCLSPVAIVADSRRMVLAGIFVSLMLAMLFPLARSSICDSLPGAAVRHADNRPLQAWLEITTWIRQHTPRDALFLMPPYPCQCAGTTRRCGIIDDATYANAGYIKALTDFQLKAARAAYGLDFQNLSDEGANRYYDRRSCEIQRRYEALIDERRLEEVKSVFPRLSFVVGIRPGSSPIRFPCGPFQGRVLDLPIAFQNDTYVVYDVRLADR